MPTPNAAVNGWWYRFRQIVAQNVVVATAVADTLIAISDLTADSVTSTVVGGEIEAVCMQTAAGVYSWCVAGIAAGGTYTIQT